MKLAGRMFAAVRHVGGWRTSAMRCKGKPALSNATHCVTVCEAGVYQADSIGAHKTLPSSPQLTRHHVAAHRHCNLCI